MYSDPHEYVSCPACNTQQWERRPPFRLGPSTFTCIKCGKRLRFSHQAQSRLAIVVALVFILMPIAGFVGAVIGDLATIGLAFIGAVVALGALVWQGRVSQVEIAE